MAGSVLGIAVLAVLVVLVVAAGITPLLLVPVVLIAGALLVVPLLKMLDRGSLRRRTGAPSDREASYEPVQDPSARP
ncbi:MAG TPA: hypothetical protein VE997_05780 [Candidatus Limnocylindria bacterium]|nr:hypothetical protein [Candidatus Limnocylindria bacterium]